MKFLNTLIFLLLWQVVPVLCYPETLNTNIEQEAQNMGQKYTPQEKQFLDYFHSIDKQSIEKILSKYHSTGSYKFQVGK